MNKEKLSLIAFIIIFGISAVCLGDSKENDLWNRESLTNGFFSLNNELADNVLDMGQVIIKLILLFCRHKQYEG